jgi:hypothetical protein
MMDSSTVPTLYVAFSISTKGIDKYIGKIIRLFTGGNVNHAFLLYKDPEWGTWQTVGANSNGITQVPLATFIRKRQIIYIFEPQFDLWQGAHDLAGDVGKSYNYRGLFGMAYVEIAERLGNKHAANFLSNDDDMFCSEWMSQMIDESLIYTQNTLDTLALRWPLFQTMTDTIDPDRLCLCMQLVAVTKEPLWKDVTKEILDGIHLSQ